MNILLNFSTLKKGGGQNVALNFIQGLLNLNDKKNEYFFLVVENSFIHEFLIQKINQNIFVTSQTPFKRIINEIFKLSIIIRKNKIDIIYTYFGYALYTGRKPQVSGIAVSNVFFPEVDFWQGNFFQKTQKKIVDRYRIFGIKKATALIFENKKMEERSHTLFRVPENKTIFIPPSFTSSFENEDLKIPELNNSNFKLLMLCGWQLNKNIMKVPEIAYYLKKRNNEFQFVITAPKDNSETYQKFKSLVDEYEVHNMISIIGPIKKQQLYSLYNQIDFVLLMSKLESFSNNIIEAWHFRKPLIASNEEWAKAICYDAAFYVNRESAKDIADSILDLKTNTIKKNKLIENGLDQIKKYPSVTEKTKREILFLEKIYNELKSQN